MSGVKFFEPHVSDCFLASSGRQEFIVSPKTGTYDFTRRNNGHRGGSTMWHVFTCNDPKCSAIVGVRWDALMEFIQTGLSDTGEGKG